MNPSVIARRPFGVAAILALCTILIRLPNFGDPTYHIDEAFYLFVGQQMHEGLLPYVDLWDRKPAGLFVLYTAIAQFGAVEAYQTAAGLFVWGTAVTLAQTARRFVGPLAACAAGALYLALLGALAGGGGQSPVFYNFFVALAAWLVLRRALGELSASGETSDWAAMVLCGVALTIKPTALPEGLFLGLVLLAVRWRDQRDAPALAAYGARLAAVALSPTVVIWAYFAATGHFGAYWFATMQSIFLTEPPSGSASLVRFAYLLSILWVCAALALAGALRLIARAIRGRGRDRVVGMFVTGWLVAAIAGFLLIPNFYDHYALPLASVLALAAAPVFDRRPSGPVLAALAIAYLLWLSGFPAGQMARKTAAQEGFANATAIMGRHAGDGCVFVYDATPALYRRFRPCPATRFAFPEHLSNQREANAIGADPVRALDSILRQDPAVIAMPVAPSLATPNLATRSVLEDRLARRYRRVGEAVLVDVVGRQRIGIWALRARTAPAKPLR